jgi:hypothetical protein
MKRFITVTAIATFAVCSTALATQINKYTAVPFTFIGKPNVCGNPYPPGHNIVTAAWLGGMGLPDDGTTSNPSSLRGEHQLGLLLNKNGLTSDCSSAGAVISNWRKGDKITQLGFDYRIGTHCGAGAPRFNVTTTTGQTYFAGCQYGIHSPAPQDAEWERVVFSDPADFFPAGFSFATSIQSISIVYDEGTDTAGLNDPNGVGLVVLDNININGNYITRGGGIQQ